MTQKENNMDKEYSLTIKGFKTPEQVTEFIKWYEGQGEQDAAIWFWCRKEEGTIDVNFMPVDCSKQYAWNDDKTNLTAWLKLK